MRFLADRMSPRNGTRSRVGLVWLILFASVLMASAVMPGSVGYGEDDFPRGNARTSAPGMELPPRSKGHASGETTPRKSVPSGGGLWTTVISLAVIVGGLGLVAYWLRPYLGGPRGLPIEAMELLGRRTIEHKVVIHLVRCGGRVLVLGVSPEGARTLSEITDPAEVQRLVAACHSPRDAKPFYPPSNGGAAGFEQTPIAGGVAPSAAATVEPHAGAERVSLFQAGESRRAS